MCHVVRAVNKLNNPLMTPVIQFFSFHLFCFDNSFSKQVVMCFSRNNNSETIARRVSDVSFHSWLRKENEQLTTSLNIVAFNSHCPEVGERREGI